MTANTLLAQEAKNDGYKLNWYPSVDSTNAVALKLALESCKNSNGTNLLDKQWVIAEEQTSGRARRGRSWYSPIGNLYSSLLLTGNIRAETASNLGFVAGVSIAEAINQAIAQFGMREVSVSLKWPNDILLDGAKSAGILLELVRAPHGSPILVIGMGINIVLKAEDTGYRTSSLNHSGIMCTPRELFKILSLFWCLNYRIWLSDDGKQKIREKWLEHCAGLGQTIQVKIADKIVSGVFATIDDEFRCIIRQPDDQLVKISSGDVYFGDSGTASAGR